MSSRASYNPNENEKGARKGSKPEQEGAVTIVRFSALPMEDDIQEIPPPGKESDNSAAAVGTDDEPHLHHKGDGKIIFEAEGKGDESDQEVVPVNEESKLADLTFESFSTCDEESRDRLCGIACWTPKCLQPLASPQAYVVITSVLGILQGAYFTYFVGVLTTLEKRFSFQSKITGIILLADNLSPILISIILGYYGRKFHRPRMIGAGILFVVLSCFLATLPYYKYGAGTHLLAKSVQGTKFQFCDHEDEMNQCIPKEANAESHTAVIILFVANFLNGVGSCAFYTLGTPYLDDNIKKKNTPMYFATLYSLRVVGPTLGFLIASFSLSFYENPFYNPGITKSDPRWIGAWWMGFLILGACILIFSIPLFMFPKELPRRNKKVRSSPPKIGTVGLSQDQSLQPSFRELPTALKRLLKNPFVVCNTLSAIFVINGYFGYITFMPKYMETQFHISPTASTLIVGSTGILATVVGIMLGGITISKLRPGPRLLTLLLVIVELAPLLSYFIAMFLRCTSVEMTGTIMTSSGLDLVNDCNIDCKCNTRVFQPVCGPNGVSTYFSPCHAGCQLEETILQTNITEKVKKSVFSHCECVHDTRLNFIPAEAHSGYCQSTTCNLLLPYIIIISIGKLISASARVGGMLVTLRSVEPQDKGLALGLLVGFACAFAFIPCPLIFGALTDAACTVWSSCQSSGNCWIYDADKFRYYLHGGAIAFLAVGDAIYFGIYWFSGRLRNLYEDDDETGEDGYRKVATKVQSEELDDITYVRPMHKNIDGSHGDLTVF